METERTRLITITKEDFAEIMEMYGEPDTFKYIEPAQNKTKAELLDFLDSRIKQVADGIGHHWVVRSKMDNEFMGLMNLNPIAGTDKIQIGFQLKRKFWNQGYASELTARVLDFGIEEAKLTVIYGVFSKRNIASRRIFEKFAFVFEESKTFEGENGPIEIWKYIARHKINIE